MHEPKPLTPNRITNKELATNVAQKTGLSKKTVEKIANHLFEEITQALERCQPVNIKDFGTFFIRATMPTRTFKFNPSQKLRAMFGWSSKYKG